MEKTYKKELAPYIPPRDEEPVYIDTKNSLSKLPEATRQLLQQVNRDNTLVAPTTYPSDDEASVGGSTAQPRR